VLPVAAPGGSTPPVFFNVFYTTFFIPPFQLQNFNGPANIISFQNYSSAGADKEV
jgi:hypothetical protein